MNHINVTINGRQYRMACEEGQEMRLLRLAENLETRVEVHKGDTCFLGPDIPHAPSNESGKPCTWIVVHSSGSDQDGIVLLPELDRELAERLAAKA